MSKRKEKKLLRSFHWKFTNRGDVTEFDKFQNLSVAAGNSPGETLGQLIREYNLKNDREFTLISEGKLIELLTKKKLKITRRTLWEWREAGLLVTDSGDPICFTAGRAVVYNQEAMVNFVRERKRSNGSRLHS